MSLSSTSLRWAAAILMGTLVVGSGVAAAAEDRYWGPECGTGQATNHGQYVSSSSKGGGARSAAARSDCGKPASSVGNSTESDPSDEPPEASAGSNGNGKVKGKGKGKGRGNSK